MTNPVKFLLGLFISALALGVIYYFIPSNKISSKVDIYSYLDSNDVHIVKYNSVKYYAKTILWGSDLPTISLDTADGFLHTTNTEDRSKFLFSVNNFDTLSGHFSDNPKYIAIENQDQTYKMKQGNGIFSFNESVLRYTEGEEIIPFEATPKDSIKRDLSFLRKDNSIYSIVTLDKEGNTRYKKAMVEEGNVIIISEPFDSENLPKNKKVALIENESSGKISILRGNLKTEGSTPLIVTSIVNEISNKLSLNEDSILKYWDGGIDFEIKSIDTITNEYITFEYDDNFEKVEKKVLKEEVFVNFYLMLEDRNKDLFAYLIKNKLLNGEFGNYTLAGMPFTTYVKTNDDGVFISSTRRASKDLSDSNDLIYLNIEDNAIFNNAMSILTWNSILEGSTKLSSFESISINGSKVNELPKYQIQMSYSSDNFEKLWEETEIIVGF